MRECKIGGGGRAEASKQADIIWCGPTKSRATRQHLLAQERLLYHEKEKSVSLRQVRWLAIDEADAMLCASDGIRRETDSVLEVVHRGRTRGKLPQAQPRHQP